MFVLDYVSFAKLLCSRKAQKSFVKNVGNMEVEFTPIFICSNMVIFLLITSSGKLLFL